MPDISTQPEPFAPAPGSQRPGQPKSWARPPSVATAATTLWPRWPAVYTGPHLLSPCPPGRRSRGLGCWLTTPRPGRAALGGRSDA